jgi:hypothetical protein
MNIDFEELFRRQMEEFDSTLDDIGIPKELFQECWLSIGEIERLYDQWDELCKEDETFTIESPVAIELKKSFDSANTKYRLLENACPDVPSFCFNALRISYETLQEALDSDSLIDKINDLILSAEFRGFAMTFNKNFKTGIQALLNEPRRSILSKAGAKGALVRLRPYAEFKSWVLENGANLGASKAVARTLEKQLPPHLSEVSEDPQRLIYETLRNRNNPS